MKRKSLRFGQGFRVALGNARAQAAEMVLKPGKAEGDAYNRHRGADQWLFVISGKGVARVNKRRYALKAAIMLFSVGGMFSLYEGWHKLYEPEELSYPLLALGVLAFGIVAESFSMWGCLRKVNKVRRGRSLWQWFRQSRNAELVVIFGEDLAALLGLTLAFVAVLAAWITGNMMYDALGSMAIGVLLVVVAVAVGIEVKALLIGQGVEEPVRREMLEFLDSHPTVDKVLQIVTLHMGSDVMVAIKARMCEHETQAALVAAINHAEISFKERFPATVWIFFEPDARD